MAKKAALRKPVFLKGKVRLAMKEGCRQLEVSALFFEHWSIHKGVNTDNKKFCVSYKGFVVISDLKQRDGKDFVRKVYETFFEDIDIEELFKASNAVSSGSRKKLKMSAAYENFVNCVLPIVEDFKERQC